ncbi:MAG: putative sugar nucleotidyl transferase [Candidatus Cloacimonetes bacterium]|nr:putative sugar nucleotidyl transferase [Candidatus Cloacimonadota bacterium]
MQLTIFDDDRIDAFYPITFSRVVGDLRCGILKQRQRISHHFESDNDSYLMDDSYCALYKLKHPDWSINESNSGLFVNSSLRVSSEAMAQIESLVDESAILAGDRVVALKTKQKIRSFPDLATLAPQLDQIYPDTETRLYSNLADLIHDNPRMIDWDYKECFYDADNFFETEPGVSVLDPYQVWIGEDAELKPGVVIDVCK